MADLAAFQAQANNIYDPQAKAQKDSLTSGYNAGKASMELTKGETNQGYERALRGVDETEKSQVSSLNSMYSQRLGGNFSGLQGNALQGLYGKDNQARADLATSRVNMLAKISGQETAALDKYNTDEQNVDARISGEKAKYSSDNYNSAVREEQRVAQEQEKAAQQERFHQDTMNMEYAKLSSSNANRASSAASKEANQYKVTTRSGGGYGFSGPHGAPVSMSEYLNKTGGDVNSMLDMLRNGSSYDKKIYDMTARGMDKLGGDPQAIYNRIKQLDGKNYYGL